MQAETTRCRLAVGLDESSRYISLARRSDTPGVEFHEHNVTETPFPVTDIDVVYCRYLLTHLSEPEQAINTWGPQLRAGGLLLAEELDSIETDEPVFNEYLEIMEALMTSNSNDIYIGR